jgi:hypothetical protein
MSGQQWGTAIGTVVGFFLPGGPSVWGAIGGFIGGQISPTEMHGPHIGDGSQQSSQEGVPIPWILGSFGWIQGNIVQKSERREVKKEDDGKGSGQVQVTYEAHQDFCIMVCESSETRNSTVVGPLIIRVNGKIVYDMRPGKNFAADNAKFLEHHTFYVGNEDQVPDPTMEAITGVGNTPSYRGVFTCVCRDINLSQYGDAIPTYEWVMVGDGEAVTVVTEDVLSPQYSRYSNSDDPLVDPDFGYGLEAERTTVTAGLIGPQTVSSVAEGQALCAPAGFGGVTPTVLLGHMVLSEASPAMAQFYPDADITDDVRTWVLYSDRAYSGLVNASKEDPVALSFALPFDGQYHMGRDGWLYIASDADSMPEHLTIGGTSAGPHHVFGIAPCIIRAHRKQYFNPPNPLPDAPGFYIDENGQIQPMPDYDMVSGDFRILQKEILIDSPGENTDRFEQYARGPVLRVEDPDNTEAFWTAAAASAGIPGAYGVDWPQAITATLIGTYSTTTIPEDQLSVATAIERIAVRGGLTALQVDTSDVTQVLMGYGITNTYDGADCIRPLLTAYGLYGADYDAQLHFHKLGEDVEIVIDPGEMIAGETHTDRGEREQAVEYPRVILLNYIDPTQDYTARPQPWRRISPDVRAIGEETMQVPVVMLPDDAARTVDTYGKRATARAQGSRKFSVPFAGTDQVYLRLHPGKSFGLDGKRWVIDSLSIEDGELAIEGTYDRQSAYTSNVTAIPALPPTPPPSSIGGVTLFAAMNLPRLRTKDNTPGMYIAVAGLLSSWSGCFLQMSTDDGETWTTAFASMTQQSVIGYLTAPVDETPDDTLSVSVRGQLNSITDSQFANGGNPAAILSNALAEIVQFRDADEVEPNEYNLTHLGRGRLGTVPVEHYSGDRFVMLTDVYFLPLDISLAGRTIKFRPVTFGTAPENNASYDVVFLPQFTGPQVLEAYVNESGDPYVNESGLTYYRIIS